MLDQPELSVTMKVVLCESDRVVTIKTFSRDKSTTQMRLPLRKVLIRCVWVLCRVIV